MNKNFKKFFAGCLVTSMVVTNMLFTTAFAAPLAGANRYETAAKIAKAGWTSADVAVLATGEDFPDALAAAPLAEANNAPILLTESGSLNAYAKDALTTLGVDKVIVVGGEKAVSAAVVTALEAANVTVERISGNDRYDTSVKVAEKLGTSSTVVLANGYSFADALSVSSIAAAKGMPILLTAKDAVSDGVKAFIGTKDVIVVGGTAVVAPSAVSALTVKETLAGANRYATNKEIIEYFAADLKFDNIFVATGEVFADALAGSAYAAKVSAPVVLVGSTLDAGVKSFLAGKVSTSSVVIALGGASTVAKAATALEEVINPTTGDLSVQSVSALNGTQLQVVFNKEVDETSAEADSYIVKDEDGVDLDYTAELQSDDKTVILTMDAALVEKGKKADITVTVIAGVIQTEDDASETAPLYTKLLTVEDNTAPSIVKVESTTNEETADEVTITFSEPVLAGAVIKIDGDSVDATDAGDETVVTGLELDAEKSHTVQIINVADASGNVVSSVTKTFSITVDTDAPEVKSVTQYTDNSILVTFNKEMDPSTIVDADGEGSNFAVKDETLDEIDLASIVADPADKDDVSFIIKLDDSTLYDNKTSRKLTVVLADEEITDSLGNELEGTTKTVTLTEDTKAPTLVNVKVLKNSSGDVTGLELEYSEAIAPTEVGYDATVIKVVNKNGVNVTNDMDADGVALEDDDFFAAVSDDVDLGSKKVVFPLSAPTDLSDEYTFTFVKGLVTDDSLATNDSAAATKTINFGAADSDDFELAEDAATLLGDTITVEFGQEVKGGSVAGSATNIANYSLEGVDLSDATVTLNSAKDTATIDISNCDVSKSDDAAVFTVVNVKNADGVTVKPYTTTVETVDNVAPVLQSAKLLSSTEIELTFNENMAVNDNADGEPVVTTEFQIKLSGTTFDAGEINAYTVSGYAKKVKLVLTNAVNLNKTITIKTLDIPTNLVVDASEGNQMKKDITVTVVKP